MEKELQDILQGFTCNFKTFDSIKTIGRDKREKVLSKIESERDISGFDDEMEDIRALNFISFLYFTLNDWDKAFKYVEEVIKRKPTSINALACKAWYHLKKSEFAGCREWCYRLQELKDDSLQMVIAKAEVAFVCSRLGMSNIHKEAETLFRCVLKECIEDCLNVPNYCICIWKFGLALIIKRQLNFHNIHKENVQFLDSYAQSCNEALTLLKDIIGMEGDNLSRIKARSFVQIGGILDSLKYQSKSKIIETKLLDSFHGCDIKQKARFCFDEALKLHTEDVFVLERSSKYYRYGYNLKMSKSLLERSLKIRPTSIAHHYMALTLKKQLEQKLKGARKNPNTTSYINNQNNYSHVRNLSKDMDNCCKPMLQQATNTTKTSIGEYKNVLSANETHWHFENSSIQSFICMKEQNEDNTKKIGPRLDSGIGSIRSSVSMEDNDCMTLDSGIYSMESSTNSHKDSSNTNNDIKHKPTIENTIHDGKQGSIEECADKLTTDLQTMSIADYKAHASSIENKDEQRHMVTDMSNWNLKERSSSAATLESDPKAILSQAGKNQRRNYGRGPRGIRGRGKRTDFNRRGQGHQRGAMVKPIDHPHPINHAWYGEPLFVPYFHEQFDSHYYPQTNRPKEQKYNNYSREKQKQQHRGYRGGRTNTKQAGDGDYRGQGRYKRDQDNTSALHRQRSLSNMIKSPQKVDPLPPDEVALILDHLDKSVELDKNLAAVYDKGLIMRRIGEEQKALEIFKSMFQEKGCSMVYLADAYEQSALCLLERINKCGDVEDSLREKLEIDAREYLKKCIEVACNLVAKLPDLKPCWKAFPTLKCLLHEKGHTKSTVKELGKLHSLVQDYNGAIGWYKKVLDMECDDKDKAQACIDIVKVNLETKNYSEAILYFDMVMCFENGGNLVDEALYFEAHIEGGLEAWSANQSDLASLRIKNALDYNRKKNSPKPDTEDSTQDQDDCSPKKFDIFVLCDENSEDIGHNVKKYLCDIGLDVTMNDEYVMANATCLSGMTEVIEISTHSVIILGEQMSKLRQLKFMTEIICNTRGEFGNTVVLTENENVKKESVFKGFPSMQYIENDKNAEEYKLWMKNLLMMIASGQNGMVM